jgi:hypothetical protein
MTPTALLADLERRGITVTAAGAQLRVVPAGRLAEADRAALRQHKPALLTLLSAGTATEDLSDRSDQRCCVMKPALLVRLEPEEEAAIQDLRLTTARVHQHICPGGGVGVPRASRCRRTFSCTAGCAHHVVYRCVCCKLDLIEARHRRHEARYQRHQKVA